MDLREARNLLKTYSALLDIITKQYDKLLFNESEIKTSCFNRGFKDLEVTPIIGHGKDKVRIKGTYFAQNKTDHIKQLGIDAGIYQPGKVKYLPFEFCNLDNF